MKKRLLVIGALGILAVIAGSLLAAACSSDTKDLENRIGAVETQTAGGGDTVQTDAQLAGMITTLNQLDAVGFHELNETIAADEMAPAGTAGPIGKAETAIAATDWPADLQTDADQFQADLATFLAAVEADTQGQEMVDAALAAHNDYHAFTDSAWTYIGDQVGVEQAPDEDMPGMEMGTGTPMAAMTPTAGG